MSTNFIIFGHMDQKLWVFKVFRRSLGRAGMCWSQLEEKLTTCAKKERQEEDFFFAQGGVRALGHS
jgi:hypothetical protein